MATVAGPLPPHIVGHTANRVTLLVSGAAIMAAPGYRIKFEGLGNDINDKPSPLWILSA
jgi:hypothetical protein